MVKEVVYSSIAGFSGFEDVVYVKDDALKTAREFLKNNNNSRYVSIDMHYTIEGCVVIDFKGLGLRICCDDESKLSSLVEKLFPET